MNQNLFSSKNSFRNIQQQLDDSTLLAAEGIADGAGFSDETFTEDGHGSTAVLVNEGNAVGSSTSKGVAVEESLDLAQDVINEGLALEELGELSNESSASVAVESPEIDHSTFNLRN